MKEEKLYRSKSDRIISGVCGGISEYYSIDPTLIRLAFVILALVGGTGLLLYLVLSFVLPEENGTAKATGMPKNELFVWIIILIGAMFLVDNFLHFDIWRFLTPLILIFLGAFFIKKNL